MKRQRCFFLILFIVASLCGCSRKADVVGTNTSGAWVEVSGMTSFRNIVANGSELYASGSGIERSTDNGMTWAVANSSIGHGDGAVAVLAGSIFSGNFQRSGVSLSSDSGATWVGRNSGLPGQNGDYPAIWCFAVNGTDLLMGTIGNGVLRTGDQGVHWTSVNDGIRASNVYCMAASGSNVLAGTELGIYRSTDGGTSWVPSDSGLATSLYYPAQVPLVTSLATVGTNVFAGTGDGKVFLSTDYGLSWSNVSRNLPPYPESSVSLAASDLCLFLSYDAGIFASTNNGSSWNSIVDNLPSQFNKGGLIAVAGGNLFVTLGSGVWRRAL